MFVEIDDNLIEKIREDLKFLDKDSITPNFMKGFIRGVIEYFLHETKENEFNTMLKT